MENKVLDYYMKGYGYVKIAEIMGKTPKSIDNALQRIRGKIRNFSLPFLRERDSTTCLRAGLLAMSFFNLSKACWSLT